MTFYTNVQMVGDHFLVRGYENGKHFGTREKFYPTPFVDSKRKTKYKTLWKSSLYDLSTYTNGYCHTYDPPGESDPDMSNRIFFMTKRPPLPWWAYNYTAHEIYIHQKGQFWPRSDMISFG